MPDALSTLLALQSNSLSGEPLRLGKLRLDRQSEFRDRLVRDPGDRRAATALGFLEDDMASDPDTGVGAQARQGKIQNTIDQVNTYNRPDVTAVRQDQNTDALNRLLLPIQAKARVDAQSRNEQYAQQLLRDRLNDEAAMARTKMSAEAVGTRQQQTQASQLQRQRQADTFRRASALDKDAAKAGTGMFDWLTGKSKKLKGEADALRSQMGGDQQSGEIAAIADLLTSDPRYAGKSLEELAGMFGNDPEAAQLLQQAYAMAHGGM